MKKILFTVLLLACLFPQVSPAMALIAGIAFSLMLTNPFLKFTTSSSKNLLQISVIILGFGLHLSDVLKQAYHALPITVLGITITIVLGQIIGKWLKMNTNTFTLISFGTAICGGSAIAAMAPAIKAKDEEISISLAVVFSLNAVALLIFPLIGHKLGMSEESFGIWAGLAIHDTSSVTGAASSYGAIALAYATTVKLARALWITPFVILGSYLSKSEGKISFPYFILGFIAAAVIRSILPEYESQWTALANTGRQLLVATLFLIGAGLSKAMLLKAGLKPLLLGITLWIVSSIFSFTAVSIGWI